MHWVKSLLLLLSRFATKIIIWLVPSVLFVGVLGWIAGPVLLTAFYLISVLTSIFLARIYQVADVIHPSYPAAVRNILGEYARPEQSFMHAVTA